jgi:predicted transglutaminase-like cysteine proteinase
MGVNFRRRNIALKLQRLAELYAVNREVNRDILPELDTGDADWLILPVRGNCTAFAVTKRHELLARGWPSRALLLSEVITLSGEHHLVLVVRTKDADLLLDNLQPAVESVAGNPEYQWVRIQSPQNPKFWLTVRTQRVGQVDLTKSPVGASAAADKERFQVRFE